ncbi:MAG: MarR family transcriptional regulator [Deltaproteobacteria bacterium]|jgi:MarR family transcriptional regulator, transcriptional regulator for hemolysin|nr:MarR family transcriptional regulator [Deltaproteobacteria bacterium]
MANKALNIEEFLGFRLQQTAWNARGQFQKIISHLGLEITIEQAQVLLSLYKNEGVSQIQLADKVFSGRTNITRIINGLVTSQLIRRQKDKTDRRCFRIYLTTEGKKILEQLIPILDNANQMLINAIGNKQHQEILQSLEDVNDIISLFFSSYLEFQS